MSISINPSRRYCERQESMVSLEQTEEACRAEHGCTGGDCPLREELGRKIFARALDVLAPGVRRGWRDSDPTR